MSGRPVNLDDFKRLAESMKKKGLIRGPGDVIALPAEFKGVSVEWIDITPTLAEAWLLKNPHNRTLRKTTVSAYAADMRDGNWLPTHQGIAFDADGFLLDGQHRLAAIVESGCTVRMLVTRGLAPTVKGKRLNTIEAVDRGAGRSAKDFLKVRGLSSPFMANACAAVIAQLCALPEKQGRVTMNQTLAILELYEKEIDWLGKNEPEPSQKYVRVATVLGAIAFGRAVEREATEKFFERLVTGAELSAANPILLLRNWLLEGGAKNHGNNRDRCEVSKRVLACSYYALEKRPLRSMKELDVSTWEHFANAQVKTVAAVRTVLGKDAQRAEENAKIRKFFRKEAA